MKTNFYFSMSLLITIVVVYGFSRTVDQNLIHPSIARPFILYVHAAVFSGWLAFLLLQTSLVRLKQMKFHRQVGLLGAMFGIAIPVMGISTAIVMARFNREHLHATRTEADLFVQFFDMIAFTVPFSLAILWKKKIEFHRRLILVASCALTSAAFGRFPHAFVPPGFFYAGVDALIFLGVLRDLILERRIHQVYWMSLPALILGQVTVMNIAP